MNHSGSEGGTAVRPHPDSSKVDPNEGEEVGQNEQEEEDEEEEEEEEEEEGDEEDE